MTTYTVNANGTGSTDGGVLNFSNLEDAVEAADANFGADTIILAPGTIQLERTGGVKDGQVFIDDDVTIMGAGNSPTTGSVITTDTSIANAQNSSSAAIITVGASATANFTQLALDGGDVVPGIGPGGVTTNGGVQAATGILFNGGDGVIDHVSIGNVGSDNEPEPRALASTSSERRAGRRTRSRSRIPSSLRTSAATSASSTAASSISTIRPSRA